MNEDLKQQVKDAESLVDAGQIQERITRLSSGVAVVRVGAPTEIEMIEKKHRIEDALEAVRSAQEQGVIAGGGSALAKIADQVQVMDITSEQKLGFKIVIDACTSPLRQMAINAGESPDLVVQKVQGKALSYGYNFMTNKVENFFETGIIDPVKVTISAIQNSVSVASTLITTNHAVVKM